MSPTQLYLYSTAHCHLCERAENLLLSIATSNPFKWKIVDISDDPGLLARYETSIPVLKRNDTQAELAWPFSEAEIKIFLSLSPKDSLSQK